MTVDKRWEYIVSLDEELLLGGVILSEWSAFLIRDADVAFVHGAHLASIITAMAGIETHLRYEDDVGARIRLVDLIDKANIDEDLRAELHHIRRYRNKWVHVQEPANDDKLLDTPEKYEAELEIMSRRAIRALRRVIYTDPLV